MASNTQDQIQQVQFVLEHVSETWHYLAWIIVAIVLCVIAMRRYGPKPPRFWGHFSRTARCLAIICVLTMLAGPAWQTTEHHIQPGQVTIAVDLSASMQREDGINNQTRVSAASDFFRALETREQAPNNNYHWKSICSNGAAIDKDDLRNDSLMASGGTSKIAHEITSIASSNQQDVIVLVSDGRSTDKQQLETVATTLREREIDIYILATGSDAIGAELEIVEVLGNRDIARGERQPFTLNLTSRGLTGQDLKIKVSNSTGDVKNEKTITVKGDVSQKAQLLNSEAQIDVILHNEGEDTLLFEVEGPDGLRAAISMQVRISERKLRVLMLAHHPRYEMRYVRNALDRDFTVDIHSYLADGRWRRWGADRFGPENIPLRASELKEYDALIIGDISANVLGIPAQENIVRAVRQSGLGLVWIPGERGTLADYKNTPLGKLIPAEIPDRESIQRGYLKGTLHQAQVTAEGRLTLNPGKIDWADLPQLIGSCPLGDELPKGSQVLMTGTDETPLIVSRPYSSGRATIIAVDDTWRWRKDVGDFYLHRFHSSLLRFTSSGRQLHRKPWQITTTPSRARLGEHVQINVNPTGPLNDAHTLPDSITLRMFRDSEEKIIRLHRAPNNNSYGVSTSFYKAGAWQLSLADGLSIDDVRNSELTILSSTAENSDPRLDLEALTALADATGGNIYTDPQKLAEAIPDRQRRRSERRIEAAWDSSWFLLIAICLFCFEWAIRRHFRLP